MTVWNPVWNILADQNISLYPKKKIKKNTNITLFNLNWIYRTWTYNCVFYLYSVISTSGRSCPFFITINLQLSSSKLIFSCFLGEFCFVFSYFFFWMNIELIVCWVPNWNTREGLASEWQINYALTKLIWGNFYVERIELVVGVGGGCIDGVVRIWVFRCIINHLFGYFYFL